MYVGVDVGGTFTDAVLLADGQVRTFAKVPTAEDLLESITVALDEILRGVDSNQISRVVFSTTMITNLIAEKKYDRVSLLLIPGPGLNSSNYSFNTDVHYLSGAVDYRGRVIAPVSNLEIDQAISDLTSKGYKKVGVVGKFSPRNTSHEKYVASIIKEKCPDWQVEVGSQIGGQLNFPRRAETTFLTCATREPYRYFINTVRQALSKRKITADVFILKADGGTLPLENAEEQPVETIFSGPAASTLGAQSLTLPGETAVVVDIGGTTTDLALILSGQPLLSSRGARVDDQLTQVRTLAVKSVPVGGDSVLERMGNEIIIYSERLGPAYCMGGPVPTPTDALKVLGLTTLGDCAKAREAMSILGGAHAADPGKVAESVIELVVTNIAMEIDRMFLDWEQEPAYRVWEIMQKKRKVRPTVVVGVGGGASGFIERIADRIGCSPVVPPYAPVANAIGAAVAKPTMQVSLRADTEQGYYIIQEEGYQGKIESKLFNEQKATELAKDWLIRRAAKYGLSIGLEEIEVTRKEVFNMIRDWTTVGRLFDITVQTPRGIVFRIGREG